MIFYEAPHTLLATLKDMRSVFGNRRISLCRELTKVHEEFFRTDFDNAVIHYEQNPPRGEFVLVIEGKSHEQAEHEKMEQWTLMTIKEHVEMYMAQGNSEKEALRLAARDRGKSRRDLYNEYKR